LSQLFKSENEYLENTVEKHRRENERLTEQNQLLLMEFEDLKHFSSDKEHQIAFMQEQTAFFEVGCYHQQLNFYLRRVKTSVYKKSCTKEMTTITMPFPRKFKRSKGSNDVLHN
jgi:hypothetical protein